MEEAFCGNQWINKGSDYGYYIIHFGAVASAREALMSEVRTGVPLKVSCKDLHVKKRIGSESFGEVKEIIWMGENFAMMHIFTNVEIFMHEVSAISKLLHPNLLHALSSFVDKDDYPIFTVPVFHSSLPFKEHTPSSLIPLITTHNTICLMIWMLSELNRCLQLLVGP